MTLDELSQAAPDLWNELVELRDLNEWLRDEVARLERMVAKWPTTRDGVVVTHGMVVWAPVGSTRIAKNDVAGVKMSITGGYEGEVDPGMCYSTEEAARAAGVQNAY